MWILENTKENSVFLLPCGDSLKVGRAKENYITLLNDKSISRCHASISITHDLKNLDREDKIPEIIMQDLSSTYGTYINKGILSDTRISKEPHALEEKDVIRFGKLSNIFTLTYKPLVTTSSQILSRESLRKNLIYLGGHLVKEWTSKCTLLIMNELKLTIKTVAALSSASHIVTPTYFEDMVNAIKSGTQLPEVTSYLPILKEPSINGSLVSFAPDPIRRTLFKCRVFIFQKKDSLKRMKTVISLSGGQSLELSETNFSKIVEDNHILIKSPDKEQDPLPSFVSQAFTLLANNGLAAIPESDIGLAILYKNTEKFCNPHFRVQEILKPQTSNPSQKNASMCIYATETQDDSEMPSFQEVSRTTIKETGESTNKDQIISQLKTDVSCSNAKSHLTNGNNSSNTTIYNESEMERENTGTAKRKREQSPSLENKSPSNKKYISALPKKQVCKETPPLPDDTEPIPIGEVETEIFEPHHFSTERTLESTEDMDKEVLRTISNQKDFSRKCNIRVTPIKSINSKESQGHDTPDEARVAKSIPFVPYTLPSLRIDDNPDQLDTVDDSVVIKAEPTSQNQLDSRVDIPNKGNWMCKREIDENITNENKRRRSEVPAPEKPFMEPQLDPSNPFAIPFPSTRRRRARESAVISSDTTNLMEQKNQIKKEGVIPVNNGSSSQLNNKNSEEKKTVNAIDNNEPFICKGERTLESVKSECEATDDVTRLGERLEKSLIVVQVVSLLRKTPLQQLNPTVNSATSGMTNFKIFKKASPLNASSHSISASQRSILPRIIGGKDLVGHNETSCRRDEFLASQTTEDERHEDGTGDVPDALSLDPTFLLPFPAMVRRRRIR